MRLYFFRRELGATVPGVLLEQWVGGELGVADWETQQIFVVAGFVIPPFLGDEEAETDEVGAAASFSKEFDHPFVGDTV